MGGRSHASQHLHPPARRWRRSRAIALAAGDSRLGLLSDGFRGRPLAGSLAVGRAVGPTIRGCRGGWRCKLLPGPSAEPRIVAALPGVCRPSSLSGYRDHGPIACLRRGDRGRRAGRRPTIAIRQRHQPRPVSSLRPAVPVVGHVQRQSVRRSVSAGAIFRRPGWTRPTSICGSCWPRWATGAV